MGRRLVPLHPTPTPHQRPLPSTPPPPPPPLTPPPAPLWLRRRRAAAAASAMHCGVPPHEGPPLGRSAGRRSPRMMSTAQTLRRRGRCHRSRELLPVRSSLNKKPMNLPIKRQCHNSLVLYIRMPGWHSLARDTFRVGPVSRMRQLPVEPPRVCVQRPARVTSAVG